MVKTNESDNGARNSYKKTSRAIRTLKWAKNALIGVPTAAAFFLTALSGNNALAIDYQKIVDHWANQDSTQDRSVNDNWRGPNDREWAKALNLLQTFPELEKDPDLVRSIAKDDPSKVFVGKGGTLLDGLLHIVNQGSADDANPNWRKTYSTFANLANKAGADKRDMAYRNMKQVIQKLGLEKRFMTPVSRNGFYSIGADISDNVLNDQALDFKDYGDEILEAGIMGLNDVQLYSEVVISATPTSEPVEELSGLPAAENTIDAKVKPNLTIVKINKTEYTRLAEATSAYKGIKNFSFDKKSDVMKASDEREIPAVDKCDEGKPLKELKGIMDDYKNKLADEDRASDEELTKGFNTELDKLAEKYKGCEYALEDETISVDDNIVNARKAFKKAVVCTDVNKSNFAEKKNKVKDDYTAELNADEDLKDASAIVFDAKSRIDDLAEDDVALLCGEDVDGLRTSLVYDAAKSICDGKHFDAGKRSVWKTYNKLKDNNADPEKMKREVDPVFNTLEGVCEDQADKVQDDKRQALIDANKTSVNTERKAFKDLLAQYREAQRNRTSGTVHVGGSLDSFENPDGSGFAYSRAKRPLDADTPLDIQLLLKGGYDITDFSKGPQADGVFDLKFNGWEASASFAGDWPDFMATSASQEQGMLEFMDDSNYTELLRETDDSKAAENNRNWSFSLEAPIKDIVTLRGSVAFTKLKHSENIESDYSEHTNTDLTEQQDGIDVRTVMDTNVDNHAEVDVQSETDLFSAGLGADLKLTSNWTASLDLIGHYGESKVTTTIDNTTRIRNEGYVEVMGQQIPQNSDDSVGPDRTVVDEKYIVRSMDIWAHADVNRGNFAGWLGAGIDNFTYDDSVDKGDSTLPFNFDVKGFYHNEGLLIGGGVAHMGGDDIDVQIYLATDANTPELLGQLRRQGKMEKISLMDEDLRDEFLDNGLQYTLIHDTDGWFVNAGADFALRDSADSAGNINARIVTPTLGDVLRFGLEGSKDFTHSSDFSAGLDAYFNINKNHTLKLGVTGKKDQQSDSADAGVNLVYMLRF